MNEEEHAFEPQQLLNELSKKSPKSLACPSRLPVASIKEFPALFQPRHPEINQKHVSDLAKMLKAKGRKGDLDPITVFVSQDGPLVVEGHHRLQAYRVMKRPDIPVVPFIARQSG